MRDKGGCNKRKEADEVGDDAESENAHHAVTVGKARCCDCGEKSAERQGNEERSKGSRINTVGRLRKLGRECRDERKGKTLQCCCAIDDDGRSAISKHRECFGSSCGRHPRHRASLRSAAEGWNVAATMRQPDRNVEVGSLDRVKPLALDVTDRTTICYECVWPGLHYASISAWNSRENY